MAGSQLVKLAFFSFSVLLSVAIFIAVATHANAYAYCDYPKSVQKNIPDEYGHLQAFRMDMVCDNGQRKFCSSDGSWWPKSQYTCPEGYSSSFEDVLAYHPEVQKQREAEKSLAGIAVEENAPRDSLEGIKPETKEGNDPQHASDDFLFEGEENVPIGDAGVEYQTSEVCTSPQNEDGSLTRHECPYDEEGAGFSGSEEDQLAALLAESGNFVDEIGDSINQQANDRWQEESSKAQFDSDLIDQGQQNLDEAVSEEKRQVQQAMAQQLAQATQQIMQMSARSSQGSSASGFSQGAQGQANQCPAAQRVQQPSVSSANGIRGSSRAMADYYRRIAHAFASCGMQAEAAQFAQAARDADKTAGSVSAN